MRGDEDMFIQKDIHPKTIAHEAQFLLDNEDLYLQMKAEFKIVKKMFGEKGASRRAAYSILSFFAPREATNNHQTETENSTA